MSHLSGCASPGESPRALRQRVPARESKTPPRPSAKRLRGRGAVRHSNSHVCQWTVSAVHQLNGAYSRADAHTPTPAGAVKHETGLYRGPRWMGVQRQVSASATTLFTHSPQVLQHIMV